MARTLHDPANRPSQILLRQSVVALVLACAACEQWKAPSRVHELEGRVDELSKVVSAMAGRRQEEIDALRLHYPSNARPVVPRGERAVL